MSEILKSKKGFILHKDSLSILNKMSDEQAGILFKAIYQYQTTGKTPDLEFGLEMAITPFINQFTRDDNAWEEERNKKAVNGFLGNLKRWHPDLYKKYNNDQITIEEAEKIIAERQSAIGGDSQPSDTIPNIANIAVNVSVKDKVSDSVNENKLIVQNEKDFDDLWKAYEPVSTSIGSKAKAKKKYQEYLKKYNHDQILEATKRYIDSCKKNNQKTKMCYGFFDEHLESYINQKEPINTEDILEKINEIADKKLFSSCRQLQSNDERVFLFLKDEHDEKALRSLPESKRTKIKAILGDMLTDKELSIQIANFHISHGK
jgi:hypothetical protein